MITLKAYLNENKLSISDAQRFDLGYKVARLWDKQKRGKKTYIIEDDFKVRNYPLNFINSESCNNLILGYINDEFDIISNLF